ncbi:hypothetical protein BJ508DRAFT_379616 [Ascobolus immersus RN42]|uniref:Uncharacterized protein n=1 Tax=Ascobolus immersus RN42 TaxID=1160509 RepID=A0A3N4HWB9_ASCIM|nr:hypothetical protein BJ508DRAFT_379616 [Ascobolus immersus RN42]
MQEIAGLVQPHLLHTKTSFGPNDSGSKTLQPATGYNLPDKMSPNAQATPISELSMQTRIRRLKSRQNQFLVQYRTYVARRKNMAEEHRLEDPAGLELDDKDYPPEPEFDKVPINEITIDALEENVTGLEEQLKTRRDEMIFLETVEDADAKGELKSELKKMAEMGKALAEAMGFSKEDILKMLKEDGIDIAQFRTVDW